MAAAADAHTREDRFQTFQDEWAVHERLEEEILAPAFRDAARPSDRHLAFEGHEEHQSIDRLLGEMRRADLGSEAFAAQCKVLRDQVEQHAAAEEKGLYAKARRAFDPETLHTLADRMRLRRLQLQGQAPVERLNHEQEAARHGLWDRLFGPFGDDDRAI